MKKFLALYMGSFEAIDAMMFGSSKEEQKKGMEAWRQWMQVNEKYFVDQGSPVGKNTRVTPEKTVPQRNEVVGYSIVQAASSEVAAKIFKDCPHMQIKGMWVDLVELVTMDD